MEKNDFLNLKPMLLDEVLEPFINNDYIFELKFDGIRCLIYINNDEIIVRSRNGSILNDIYPELESIKNITKDECIFDGEIVLLDNGKPSFKKVMQRFRLKDKFKIKKLKEENPVTFVCFDILYKKNDLTNLPLKNRKKILERLADTSFFVKCKYIENNGKELFEIVKKQRLEGIVAKRKDSKYFYDQRTSEWLKIKNWINEIFFICGYEENLTQSTINIILGEKINNDYYYVGKVIMGKKNKLYAKILSSRIVEKYLKNYDNKTAKIIKPKYTLPISYIERTSDNMLREAFINKNVL